MRHHWPNNKPYKNKTLPGKRQGEEGMKTTGLALISVSETPFFISKKDKPRKSGICRPGHPGNTPV
jgi:hypothetical protein